MLFSFVVILVANMIRCDFEVGMEYNYFYKTDSKLVSTESDDRDDTTEQPLIFSCLATIICTSANANGHEFLLKLTGIHLTLKDATNNGKVLTDYASLQIDRDYSKQFAFTILNSGSVADVKATKDEPEEILTIKTGIIGMFISVSENEIHSPVETIDNQGIYMSHWENKTSQKADTVELSRHFSDEDFIHFRDDNIDEHSLVLHVMEKRKIKAGVVSEVYSENTLLLAGKQFVNEKWKVARRNRNRQRMYNGVEVESNDDDLGDDELEYEGTEVVQQATTTLKHLSTKPVRKHSSLASPDEPNGADMSNESDGTNISQLKRVAHFSRDFYSTRAETQKQRGESLFKVGFGSVNRHHPSSPESLEAPNITFHKRHPKMIYDPQTVKPHRHADRVRMKAKEWRVRETEKKNVPSQGHARSLGVEWKYGDIGTTVSQLPCTIHPGFEADPEEECPDEDRYTASGIWENPTGRSKKSEEQKKKEQEAQREKDGKTQSQYRHYDNGTLETDKYGEPIPEEDLNKEDDEDDDNPKPRFCVPDDDFMDDFPGAKDNEKTNEKAMDRMAHKIKVNQERKQNDKYKAKHPGTKTLSNQPPSMFRPSKPEMSGGRANQGDPREGNGWRPCKPMLENCVHFGVGYASPNDNTGFFTDASIYAGISEDCKIFNCSFLVGAYAYAKFKIIGKDVNLIDIYAEFGFVDNKPMRQGVSVKFFLFDPLACRFKDPACRREDIPIKFKKEPKLSVEHYFLFLVGGMVPVNFGLGLVVAFGAAFFLDMCLYNGSISVGLEPSLTIKAFVSVSVGIGYWKFRLLGGVRVVAEITVAFVPEVGLIMGALQLFIKATIEISPLRAALELFFNIMGFEGEFVVWEYNFGGWEITLFNIPFTFDPRTAEHLRLGMETMAVSDNTFMSTQKRGSSSM